MTILISYSKVIKRDNNMATANIAEIKNHFSSYLKMVMNGEPVEVCKRNIVVARMVPVSSQTINKTKLGCGKGSVKIHGDITAPAIEDTTWAMLSGAES